jgi:hypothetical protein
MPCCLPDVSKQAQTLQRDGCQDSELCLPCFDPRSGVESGACRVGNDRPLEPAPEFESCCGGSGACWATSALSPLLTAADLERLGRDSCLSTGALCVPENLLQGAAPASCRALGDLEGRCVSRCLPDIAAMSAQLARGSCAASELCAPCYNPQTLEATGACSTGKDQPLEAPKTFAACCGSGDSALGVCVPVEYLSLEQRQLPPDSCNAYDARCVPARLFKAPTQTLDRCTTALAAPGICFDECFLRASEASVLASCGDHQRCVPCSTVSAQGIGCE